MSSQQLQRRLSLVLISRVKNLNNISGSTLSFSNFLFTCSLVVTWAYSTWDLVRCFCNILHSLSWQSVHFNEGLAHIQSKRQQHSEGCISALASKPHTVFTRRGLSLKLYYRPARFNSSSAVSLYSSESTSLDRECSPTDIDVPSPVLSRSQLFFSSLYSLLPPTPQPPLQPHIPRQCRIHKIPMILRNLLNLNTLFKNLP